MRILKFYTDVTHETLKNEEFAERVMGQIPKSVLDGALREEDTAAKITEMMMTQVWLTLNECHGFLDRHWGLEVIDLSRKEPNIHLSVQDFEEFAQWTPRCTLKSML